MTLGFFSALSMLLFHPCNFSLQIALTGSMMFVTVQVTNIQS